MIKPLTAAALIVLLTGYQAVAQTIYPIDRAAILAGSRFDFKVEFPDRVDPSKLKVTVNGEDHATAFGQPATFVEREDNRDQSALILRDVTLTRPGAGEDLAASGDLDVTSAITLLGDGWYASTIAMTASLDRVFEVHGFSSLSLGDVTLTGGTVGGVGGGVARG